MEMWPITCDEEILLNLILIRELFGRKKKRLLNGVDIPAARYGRAKFHPSYKSLSCYAHYIHSHHSVLRAIL